MSTTPGLPGMGRLPNVPAEIDALRKHFPDLTLLDGTNGDSSAPVKATVLAGLADHPIAHFSCHGHSDPSDPSRSRLLLLDHERDPFTIESLGPVALDNAQLAYLSACSTASPLAIGLLDESVHLASAFQIAGFPHVISTLWEINDLLAVTVADDFYTHLRDETGHLDTDRAAHAIHRAVLNARDGKDGRIRNPFLWASYIHVGTLFVVWTRQLRIQPANSLRRARGPEHGDCLMN
jgi:CHAT domain-containing protein